MVARNDICTCLLRNIYKELMERNSINFIHKDKNTDNIMLVYAPKSVIEIPYKETETQFGKLLCFNLILIIVKVFEVFL